MDLNRRHRDICLLAVAASLLFSCISILSNPVPNVDAYTYLRTTEIFLQEGAAAAFSYYPWATYAIITGGLHALTGMDLLLAARCLNALFFGLVTYAFIRVAQEIDGSRRFTLFAALTLLLYPQLNEYRADVIRDIAYLAFSLVALLALIRLNRHQQLRHAVLFVLACGLAILFRAEALAFLLLAPLALLWNRDWPLRVRIRGPLIILGAVFLVAAIAAFVATVSSDWMTMLADAVVVYRPFLDQAVSLATGGDPALAAAIFHEHAAQYSGQYITLFLVTGLLSILLIKLFTGLGWVYFGALIYGAWNRRIRLPAFAALPVAAYLLVALLILLGFVLVTRFLSSRYAMLFSLVLVLLVPVMLERTAAYMSQKQQGRRFRRLLALVVLYLFIDSFISFGESKNYHLDAVDWLQTNVPPAAHLHTTNPYIAYRLALTPHYDRLGTEAADLLENSEPGEYLVLDLHAESEPLVQAQIANRALTLITVFPSTESPRLGVYLRQ